MPAKWFCNDCGKEIWKSLNKPDKETETVAEMERVCRCSDCMLRRVLDEDIPEGYNGIGKALADTVLNRYKDEEN